MTGLESILDQIISDAKQEADEQLAAAQREKSAILAEAKVQADEAAAAILKNGEEKAATIRERAQSAAQMERRNAMLAFKQQIIGEAIDQTRASMENAPDEEYFQSLLTLVEQFAKEGSAKMRFNSKDLNRLPADFAARLKEAAPKTEIEISKEPIDLESGFLLTYGDIDINCTFEAIFEGASAQLRDAVSRSLWQVKA